jgi:alkanesulfonate monooxygenase SsuD/methylene tetrahydromethanopterin reductase-like flavin-dependent oxidoreductase (luciferase family)
MRFSVWPNLGQPWADVLAVATHAEATGWDGVYAADHFMGDGEAAGGRVTPMLEATAALAALAQATGRVRLGSLVFGITYRHPAVLAKWAATTDHISGGRLLLGVGAGWQLNEHEQYGIQLGPPGERIDRFVEALEVLRGLLREPATTVDGDHYQLRDALAEPKPLQDPLPILIGGRGDRMLGVVAAHADEWNMWASPEAFAERSAALDARCAAGGRDPAEIARSCQALWFISDDQAKADDLIARAGPRPAVGGPVERLVDAVGAWADVGVDEVIVPDFTLGRGAERLERLDLIIEEIAPAFRAA